MSQDRFWAIVEKTWLAPRIPGSIKERNRRYQAALAQLTPQEILEFQRALTERMMEAKRWDLWAAATLINDSCTASSFRDFRAWLIAQGRNVFEAALRDPESLADNPELKTSAAARYPAFWSMPWQVYREVTGKNMPNLGIAEPAEPAGKKFSDVHAELAEKFPRLFKAFYREAWDEKGAESQPEPRMPPPLKTPVPPMAEDRFWSLIDESRKRARKKKLRPGQDFIDVHITELHKLLVELTPKELIAYQNRFQDCWYRSYRWDLWGFAYWLLGGCSNGGFADFRACLVSLGKEWYSQALKDPDSLTDLIGRPDVPYMGIEGFQYVAIKVYQEKTATPPCPRLSVRNIAPSNPQVSGLILRMRMR